MRKQCTQKSYLMLCMLFLYTFYFPLQNMYGNNLPNASLAVETDFSTVPWEEDWEDEVARNQWVILDANEDGSTWKFVKSPFFNHPEEAGPTTINYTFSKQNDGDDWFFSPLTKYEAGKTYKITWWEYGGSVRGGEHYDVTIGPNTSPGFHTKVLFQQAGTGSSYHLREITFSVDVTGDYRLGWHVVTPMDRTNLYIDGIKVNEVNTVDMKALDLTGTKATSVGVETTYYARVQNNGTGDITGFRVSLVDKDENELGFTIFNDAAIKKDSIVTVAVNWIPSPYELSDNFEIRPKVTATGDLIAKNDIGEAFSVIVYPYAYYNVDFGSLTATTSGQTAPFDFRGKYSGTQSIYFEKELNKFGYINSITYYSNFEYGGNYEAHPIEVYMSVIDTSVVKVPNGWIKDDLELVYKGTADFLLGKNRITIELEKPFLYMGGNLVITTIRPDSIITTSYGSKFFYTSDNNKPGRTRTWSGKEPFNYSQTGSTPSTIPNTSFVINSYGGGLTGTITDDGSAPVPDAVIKINGTDWEAVSNAEGKYAFPFIPVGTYALTVEKIGHIAAGGNADIVYEQTTTRDFVLERTVNVVVSGKVSGIEGATVVLSGETTYQVKTNANGEYRFDNVYGPKDYMIKIFKSNRIYYEESINIPGTPSYSLSEVSLEECQGTPVNNLLIEENTPEWYNVTLNWQAPAGTVKGYLVYRDGILLTTGGFVEELTYIDKVDVAGQYTYEVKAVSGNGCISESREKQIDIDQNPCEVAYIGFPLYEGFESNEIPSCWSQEYTLLRTPWEIVYVNESDVTDPYRGKFNAKFRTVNRGTVTKLIMPKMDITGLSKPVVNFARQHPGWGADINVDELRIYYRRSETGPWFLLKEFTNSQYGWSVETIVLPDASDDYWIAFEGTSHYGKGLYLDDIKVVDDICVPVSNVAIRQLTETSVELAWDEVIGIGLQSYKVKRDGVEVKSGLEYPVYVDTGISLGNHTYEIIAVYSGRQDCSESAPVRVSVNMVERCDPVVKLKSVIQGGKVKLTWEAPTAKNVGTYTVKKNNQVIASNLNAVTYEDSNPSDGYNTYCVIVNYGGKSCTESEPECTEILVKCDAVNDLNYEVADTRRSIRVTWKADVPGPERNPIEEGKARIILKSLDIWGDGTGYQMLLDTDANTFGTIIPSDFTFYFAGEGNISSYIYNQFEYKIPANADGIIYTKNIISNGEGYVDVPAGTYDYCIMRPLLDDKRMGIADGIYGRGAGANFEAGKIYTFEIIRSGIASVTDVRINEKEEIASFEVYRNNQLVTTTRSTTYIDAQVLEGGEYEYCIIPKYDSGCQGAKECKSVKVDCVTPYSLTLDLTQGEQYCTAELNWEFEEFPKGIVQNEEDGVVFDNGPIITHTGIGYEGADVSAVDGNKATWGFGVSSTSFVMDDFVLTEKTFITEMEFFVMFWNLADPTIHPDEIYLIIIGDNPSNPYAPILWGDWTTNRYSSSKFTGVYRVYDGFEGSSEPDRFTNNGFPIISVKGTVETILPPGRYWVGMGAKNTEIDINYGPYVVPVSILGQGETGDGVTVRNVVDSMVDGNTKDPLGVSFKVHGSPTIPLFNIYRGDELIATDVEGNSYTDTKVPGGVHTWKVVFQCEGGESNPATVTGENCTGTSIDQTTVNDVKIYPNPAQSYVVIEGSDAQKVEIYNVTGTLIETIDLTTVVGQEIGLKGYASGMYIFKVYRSDNSSVVKNIMIK